MAERRQYSRGEWISAGVFLAVVLLVFASCSPDGPGDDSGTGGSDARSASDERAKQSDRDGLLISAAQFTEWPFTVTSGRLKCEAGSVTFEPAGGPRYGVNGTAKSVGYPDVTPIWADDEDLGYGLKVDISQVLNRGLSLC